MKGKIGSKIRSIFFSHWLLKIMSLLLAFALWFLVISTNDPVDEKRFQNIRVNLLNTELLTENGQVYEVLDNTDVLRNVTFDAPNSVRREIQSSDIIAEADLTNLTVTNTVEIKFSCPKYGDKVQNISGNIEYVKLNIEKKDRKTIDIDIKITGNVEEGYVIGSKSLDRNRLEVQGPESAIAEIYRAEVEMDVTGITGTSTALGTIKLLDKSGNEVSRASVSKNLDTVNITVEMWETKEIPVLYSYSGTAAEGYEDTGEIEGSIATVKVAGPSDLLKSVTELEVKEEDVSITGEAKDYETRVQLRNYLPKGVYFAEDGFEDTATVKVLIEKIEQKRISLRPENIQIINVPEDVTCEIVGSSPLVVEGRVGYVALLQESSLPGVVDVGDWIEDTNPNQPLEGDYSLTVNVSLLPEQRKISSPSVTLRFTPVQDEDGNEVE